MSNIIRYIGFYDVMDSKVKRNVSPAAVNKMDYICSTFNQLGYNVQIISPAYSIETNCKYNRKEKKTISDVKELILFSSFGSKNKIFILINIILTSLLLFFWLLVNVKKGEKIVVYHSLWLVIPVLLAKSFRNFQYILELEEIYSDITHKHFIFKKLEKKIINHATSFVLATSKLRDKIAISKNSICLYGSYKVYPKQNFSTLNSQNEKIKLLYAGIIDKEKAGAYNSLDSMRYLPKKYSLSIIGFGEIEPFKIAMNTIKNVYDCDVSYNGIKTGNQFVQYCQEHQIGLSTQNVAGEYVNSSFPSKILTYLSLGVNVVSCNIECVKDSPFGDLISYYEDENPSSIAKAIINAALFPSEVLQARIEELDGIFIKELKFIIENE